MGASNNTTKRRRTLRLGVASVVVSVVFALVVAEIVVRIILPYNSPDRIREHSVEYIPTAYARQLMKPVGRLVDIDNDKAWGDKPADAPTDELIYISKQGYRGPEFDVRNADGKTRIIVIGGSAVFDQNVKDTRDDHARTWPHLVEKRLRARGFKDVEVINAGIPGHATPDSLGRLVTQLWMYDPAMIVVYHGWNDIKFWHAMPVSPERPLISHVPPYDPTSNPFTNYRGALDRLLSNSQIYMKLRNRYFVATTNVGAEGASASTDMELADEYGPFGPAQFRLSMEAMVSTSRHAGARPVLITQATLLAADNSAADLARIGYNYQHLSHTAMLRAFHETYSIIRDVSAATGADVIDAATPMNGNSAYFSDHVHTSPEGSARLAEIIADGLAPLLAD